MLCNLPSTVRERWFAQLYLLKPMVIGGLALFWTVSGLMAVTVVFDAAAGIPTARGFPLWLAQAITLTSLADIVIGLAIARRSSCRVGFLAGIALALAYMASATIIAPETWLDPLGALVKTGPAIVLMIVALAMLNER